jgi:GT2 family glycosyltransferase
MKVVIGITTRNRADILAKAVRSALDQDYLHKEVAVFDDASSDETPQLRARFPMVSWYRAETNMGLLAARNKMMRGTDADYYFSLDDDAWFIKGDEISAGVSTLEEQSEVAAVAYDILSPDRPAPTERSNPRKTHTIIGCGHLLRLSAVKDVGYYIPSPGMYGSEEQDLCIRLLDRQYEIAFLPGVHVWHDRTMLARDSTGQHASSVCNDLTFAFRRSPGSILVWLFPGKIISHMRFAITHGLVRSCLKGIGIFLKELPNLRSTRKPVSASIYKEFRRRAHSTL